MSSKKQLGNCKPDYNFKIETCTGIVASYNRGQNILGQLRKTVFFYQPQAIENSFKRAYGEIEDNIIIYIQRLKT